MALDVVIKILDMAALELIVGRCPERRMEGEVGRKHSRCSGNGMLGQWETVI